MSFHAHLSHRAAIAGLSAGLIALGAPISADAGMGKYRWKNRPLVVFAASASDPRFRQQMGIVSRGRSGLRDRDMVVIRVVGDTVTTRLGRGPGLSAAALRRRYGVKPGQFRALLVGKDTGVKISSAQPLSLKRLFVTIDAMPMRRREMRQRGS